MVGKRVRGALYIHRSAAHLLSNTDQKRIQRAADHSQTEWNVARMEAQHLGLLSYADFFACPFPPLRQSVRVDLSSGAVVQRSYVESQNPLILHRKEQLLVANDPHTEEWTALTAALEAQGLFRDSHLIGRRIAWDRRLAAAGVRVEGHVLCRI
jgi:hypothetical protein